MCYVSGKSKIKIAHTMQCRFSKMIKSEYKVYYQTLEEVSDAGMVRCKYCDRIAQMMRKENEELTKFCKNRGIYPTFSRADGTVDIISHSGQWKIIMNGSKHDIWLYHKNTLNDKNTGLVPGYHSQKARSETIMGYVRYIVDHDEFRSVNPLYGHQSVPTGRKAKKKHKRLEERAKRRQSINYVLSLIDAMSKGAVAY